MSSTCHPVSLPDWDNLDVIHRNVLPPRSDFYLYANETDALTRDTSKAKCQLLSGTWQFSVSTSPFTGHIDFWRYNFDTTQWDDITVPGHWQCQNLGGPPHYTNIPYPFPVDPPHVPYEDNETGRYRTNFHVDAGFASDHQLRLRFEGVDSAFKVWINGVEVGYSQGARNPSEFDVTQYVRVDEENQLAVEVYSRCDGTYLEDQDQWWLSGIFRDVYLHAFPLIHPEDISVQTFFDAEYQDARLLVELKVNKAVRIKATLRDDIGAVVSQTSDMILPSNGHIEIFVKNPLRWTAETPNLYLLSLTSDFFSLALAIGFRQIETLQGILNVNGSPIKFRGVNRHEHHPEFGRTVPFDFLQKDLMMMKQAGINAIRTSHYPNDSRFYDLADRLGFWIIDEADLECHGFDRIGEPHPERFTSENPAWLEAYLDRARQLVYRDRNHASVIIWSLGNEAFFGENHRAMYSLIKNIDPTRLVHYEQDRKADVVDMVSVMYPNIPDVIAAAQENNWVKPYVLCEFAYAGGNGVACADEYFDIFYKYPRCMGGFIWEWSDHGLRTKTREGDFYYGYGGDFGDYPNDGVVLMNGICKSDRQPGPNLSVYQKAIETVKVIKFQNGIVSIINRYDFLTLDHVACHWSFVSDGGADSQRVEVTIPKGIKPHTEAQLKITGLPERFVSETYLQLSFSLKKDTSWAMAGHQVAWGELALSGYSNIISTALTAIPASPATIERIGHTKLQITSASRKSTWEIDLIKGALISWIRDGSELMAKPFVVDLWRALIEPDRRSHGIHWLQRRVNEVMYTSRKAEWSEVAGSVIVTIESRIGPPVQAWGINLTTRYTIQGESLEINVKGRPSGPNFPETLPRIGLSTAFTGVEKVKWWGRGPGESYIDKKLHQPFGMWERSIDDMWIEYDVPQESGNRTDVRWVEFLGASNEDRRLRASFGAQIGCSFNASHYEVKDIDESKHIYELSKRQKEETFIRLDWVHQGVGSALIETGTVEEKYKLVIKKEFEFSIVLD
ncbi:glycosyl hydrolases family 2, TIM barrel domain-containing protein [Dendryphion nanum]|uniref:beta-galactosidase n=1 Tax=Dendryphion nanum TaxID=256645 RepID=A0A9P9ISI7_9PLEO|nr:glycosyl hydrolases family 2, TIM barrel domain-containing protein [Dendryphion nanum]